MQVAYQFNEPAVMNNRGKPALVVEVAEADFETEVLRAKQPVLVEFWAPWSQPCRRIDAVLKEIATAWVEKVKVVKVNVDNSLNLSLWYDIQSIPTLLYFLKGTPCIRVVGAANKEALVSRLKSLGAAV